MKYRVVTSRETDRELRRMPRRELERTNRILLALGENPLPRGTKKLQGTDSTWRVRMGEYRIIYSVDDTNQQLIVEDILRRTSQTYRRRRR